MNTGTVLSALWAHVGLQIQNSRRCSHEARMGDVTLWGLATPAGSKMLALSSQFAFTTNIWAATSIFYSLSDPCRPGDLDKISPKRNTWSPLFPEPQDSITNIRDCARPCYATPWGDLLIKQTANLITRSTFYLPTSALDSIPFSPRLFRGKFSLTNIVDVFSPCPQVGSSVHSQPRIPHDF